MSVKDKIAECINQLRAEGETCFPFLYNSKLETYNPATDWILYSGPYWDDEEIVAAIESLITGKWVAAGEHVARFEREFAKMYNFESSLMVNSGSSANLVMIAAMKKYYQWNDGDEIIISPVGFPTTIAPIVQNRLKPVFVDITYHDLNFDLDHVEAAIHSNTKGVVLSPVLGNPPNMDDLVSLCKKGGITLLLDGCDALGSKWNGKHLSDYAEATTCSFYPAHHITTGEGGMVSSHNDELVSMARRFAWWGRDCYCTGSTNLSPIGTCGKRFAKWIDGYDHIIDHKYLFSTMGYNLKPLDLQGAIGCVQLKKSDEIHTKRRATKSRLEAIFTHHLGDRIAIPQEVAQAETSWFGVPIICNESALKQELVKYFESHRIQTRNYFAGNILQHPGYHHLDDAQKFPCANRVLDNVFFVGCHPSYNEAVLARVSDILSSFVKNHLMGGGEAQPFTIDAGDHRASKTRS